jgi:hypothetical protein
MLFLPDDKSDSEQWICLPQDNLAIPVYFFLKSASSNQHTTTDFSIYVLTCQVVSIFGRGFVNYC